MEGLSTSKALLSIQQLNREINRQLAEIEVTSKGYKHVCQAQVILLEQMNQIMSLMEQVGVNQPEKPTASRGRGAVKRPYLRPEVNETNYLTLIQSVIQRSREENGFRMIDGTLLKPSLFLTCLYEAGIQRGYASEGAPVKSFMELIDQVTDVPIGTAYNTIQRIIRDWRCFAGDHQIYNNTLHLHTMHPDDVLPSHQAEYAQCLSALRKVNTLMDSIECT
ncbi:MAG: hypothetical protein ACI3ZY_14120 [Parabacteroides sp.]